MKNLIDPATSTAMTAQQRIAAELYAMEAGEWEPAPEPNWAMSPQSFDAGLDALLDDARLNTDWREQRFFDEDKYWTLGGF